MQNRAEGLLRGVDFFHQAALFASSLTRVNDALGSGHIEALNGKAQCLWVLGCTDCLGGVLQACTHFALRRAVARGGLGVGEDSLLLALDICHFDYPFFR